MKIAIPLGMDNDILVLRKSYVKFIITAGYIPFIVVPGMNPMSVARYCDALILPGGIDVDPIFYNSTNYASFATNPEKDAFERSLLRSFITLSKPVFGICRGFQLIILEYIREFGSSEKLTHAWDDYGTVLQDIVEFIQDVDSHNYTVDLKSLRNVGHHYVWAKFDLLYGKRTSRKIMSVPVNSMHHQGLGLYVENSELEKHQGITDNLSIVAWTEHGMDEEEENHFLPNLLCEAFTIKSWHGSRVMAVQWHPEELGDVELIVSHFGSKAKEQTPKKKAVRCG
jgi:gamma-glutamyl-gamma-aminobutyrate hydrolase PuuD